jgi:hypothetical protein
MKNVFKQLVTIGLFVTAFQVQAQVITAAWTGVNGNLTANSAVGSISFSKYEGIDIVLQGGAQNNIPSAFTTNIISDEITEVKSFTVYPNPSTNMIFVDIPTTEKKIQIFNLQGKLVHTTVPGPINLTDLAPGMYILQAKGYKSTRIIKK